MGRGQEDTGKFDGRQEEWRKSPGQSDIEIDRGQEKEERGAEAESERTVEQGGTTSGDAKIRQGGEAEG